MSPNARLTLAGDANASAFDRRERDHARAARSTLALQGNLFAFGDDALGLQGRLRLGHADPRAPSPASPRAGLALRRRALTPDATTPNALDVNLALSPTGLAASAQDLTQSFAARPRRAARAHREPCRTASSRHGGALGESAAASAGQKGVARLLLRQRQCLGARRRSVRQARSGFGRRAWVTTSTAPRRFIAGIDWRLDNGIVAGVAATYVATSAKLQGRLEHQCELVSGRGLRRLGGRAVVRAWEARS